MPKCLESLFIPKSHGVSPLTFPISPDGGRGTVTVICGENGTGKSYILRALKDLVDAKQASNNFPGWKIGLEGEGDAIKIVHPHHHKERMNNIGILSEPQAAKSPRSGDEAILLKLRLFAILMPLALKAFQIAEEFNTEKWLDFPKYRASLVRCLPVDEEYVAITDTSNVDFLALFSDITGGTIGFRRVNAFLELVLIWRTGVVATYPDWSHGQKSLFSILSEVKIEQPDVCIYDEIENFFHPKYISQTLEFLKNNVGQTILASHHPHLIFGRAIDEVYFVELEPGKEVVASQIKRRRDQIIPQRRFTRLRDDFDRLAYAYKLFELEDAHLLMLAATVSKSVEITVRIALANAFECCAIPGKPTPYPDAQTRSVGQAFEKHLQGRQHIHVLDWGAGLGRTVDEIGKIPSTKNMNWTLYEPSAGAQSILRDKFSKKSNFQVLHTAEEASRVAADVALITNVLHILDPKQFMATIRGCWNAITQNDGILVISEIFPLLQPEKAAIPIPEFLISQYLRNIGFKVESIAINISGCSVYCLTARPPQGDIMDEERLESHTITFLVALRREFEDRYNDFSAVRTLDDQKRLLNWTFGLARVHTYLREMQAEA